MIPGLGMGLSLGGGSSESSASTDSGLTGESGINVNASKGIMAKDLLAFAPVALIVVVGGVFVIKALK